MGEKHCGCCLAGITSTASAPIHGSTAAGSVRCAGKTSTPEQAPALRLPDQAEAAHRMYRRAAAAARPSSRHFAGNVFLFSKITFLELLRTHPLSMRMQFEQS